MVCLLVWVENTFYTLPKFLRVIDEVYLPLLVRFIEYLVVYCIESEFYLGILRDGINRTPYIFSIVPWPLELPIPTWKFLLSIDLVKYLHLGSIPIDRFECVYEVIFF